MRTPNAGNMVQLTGIGLSPVVFSPFAMFLMEQGGSQPNPLPGVLPAPGSSSPAVGGEDGLDYAALDEFISGLNFTNDALLGSHATPSASLQLEEEKTKTKDQRQNPEGVPCLGVPPPPSSIPSSAPENPENPENPPNMPQPQDSLVSVPGVVDNNALKQPPHGMVPVRDISIDASPLPLSPMASGVTPLGPLPMAETQSLAIAPSGAIASETAVLGTEGAAPASKSPALDPECHLPTAPIGPLGCQSLETPSVAGMLSLELPNRASPILSPTFLSPTLLALDF